MHSTSWNPRQHIFEFWCWNWSTMITLNCFDLIKPVFDVVMMMVDQFQSYNQNFKFICVHMILEIVDVDVHVHMSFVRS